jgi:hypothetical protein
MTTGKKVYYWATRDVLRYSDHEGHGRRLVHDAPLIAARLKAHPQVREVLIAAYPDLRKGTGLYVFVEGGPGLAESTLRDFIAADGVPKPPEYLQVIEKAAAILRRDTQRNLAARRHEPGRFDRPADPERARARTGGPHPRGSPQHARPLYVLALSADSDAR